MDIMEDLASEVPKIDEYFDNIIPRTKETKVVSEPIWDILNRGGKRFRPVMCILSCKAVGGDPKKAVHTAVVIELFHNFTLIHDDIEDDSEIRRGRQCAHRIYGIPITINSGDGMLLYTLKALDREDKNIHKVLYDAFIQVLHGQGTELYWNSKKVGGIRESDYFRMVGMKTGALISAACAVGGMIGGGTKAQVEALATYGKAVGTAFQIQDDILNITGKQDKYKKEIGGDITEGKRTLMTIHALKTATKSDSKELYRILNKKTQDKNEISKAIRIMKRAGSIEYAKKKAMGTVIRAKRKLKILPKNKATTKLLKLAEFLIERDF